MMRSSLERPSRTSGRRAWRSRGSELIGVGGAVAYHRSEMSPAILWVVLVAAALGGAAAFIVVRRRRKLVVARRRRATEKVPRHPVVLVHGFMGFDEITMPGVRPHYFLGIA